MSLFDKIKSITAIGLLDNPKQPIDKNWIIPFLMYIHNLTLASFIVICSVLHVVHGGIDMVSAFDKRKLV